MQNQAEYRENAMRDRHQTVEWFGHNQQPTAAVAAAGVSSGHRPSTGKKLSQESEAWFEYGNGSTPSTTARNGVHEQQRQAVGPGRSNGSQNWFQHDDGPAGIGSSPRRDLHPIGVSQSKVKKKPVSEERKAREAAAGNPNDWYRHDHKDAANGDNVDGRESTPIRPYHSSKKPSPSAGRESDDRTLWFAGGEPSKTTQPGEGPKARTRHANAQTDAYYQRDKSGSGADWFPHTHDDQSNSLVTSSSSSGLSSSKQSQQRSAVGGNRMNIESPDWFSHEDPPAPTSPRSAASPEVRKMLDRASGDEVRQILRIEENLDQRREHNGGSGTSGGSESGRGSGSADVYAGSLVEKFQQQAALTTSQTD